MDFFFFAIRYSAFKAPIGVDSDKTKPVNLLLLLYVTIHLKKRPQIAVLRTSILGPAGLIEASPPSGKGLGSASSLN